MLEVKDLEFRYQYRRIISQLSFQVKPGELLHIVGPNGCGKTTLMSLLAGLRREQSGTITFRKAQGQVLTDRREAIEYLPAEANALYGKMDAMQNLRFWTGLRQQVADEHVLRAELARWDLDHALVRQNFPVERFSTGMKRRLALARVNLSGAPCWLLDEPLYGLDTKGIQTFQAMLDKHLLAGGLAVIVSHDTAPLQPFALQTLELRQEKRS